MSYKDENISINRISIESNQNSISGELAELIHPAHANNFYPFIQDFGGNSSIPGLTIETFDDLNQERGFITSHTVTDKNRLFGDLLNPKKYFFFKECKNPNNESQTVASAWCFAGQKINIKINQSGHAVGSVGNDNVYTKTTVDVIVHDILGKTSEIIKVFDKFEVDINSTDRYVILDVPELNFQNVLDSNEFGRLIIEIKSTFTLYSNSDWTTSYENMNEIVKSSFLQLNFFSAQIEANKVTTITDNIFNESIGYEDSYGTMFDKSIFREMETNSHVSLTENQKRAIITDQVAFLFTTQHAVVSADYFPSKIIGYGGEESILPIFDSNDNTYIASSSLSANRMFGLNASYKRYSFVSDIDGIVASNAMSIQMIQDPTRIYITDENGKINDSTGNSGIFTDPFSKNIINAEVPNEAYQSTEFEVLFNSNSIEIGNISFSNDVGQTINENSNNVKVSFEYFYGIELLKNIRVSIYSANFGVLDSKESSSAVTNMAFKLETNIITITKASNQITQGDILSTKIEIEDVYGLVSTFYKDLYVPFDNNNAGILKFYGAQSRKGSNSIEIAYVYSGTSEINNTNIDVLYSLDSSSWSSIANESFGDIGVNIMPGHNRIIWIVPNSVKSLYPNIIFLKIILTDIDGKSNTSIWKDKIATVSCDFRTPDLLIREKPTV